MKRFLFPIFPVTGSLFLLCLVLTSSVSAQADLPPAYIITADTAADNVFLPDSCWQMLADPSGKMTLQEVIRSRGFQDTTRDIEYGSKTYWLRYQFINKMPKKTTVVVPLDETAYSDVYVKTGNAGWEHYRSGFFRPRSRRDGLKDLIAVNIPVPAGDSVIIYERDVFDFNVTDLSRENVSFGFTAPVIQQQRTYHIRSLRVVFVLGMFFLAVIINLYFFIIVREKEFLYFALVLFFSGINSLHNIADAVLPDHPRALFYMISVSVIFTYYVFFHFERYFLKTFRKYPVWDKYLIILSFAQAAIFSFELFASSVFRENIGPLLSITGIVTRVILGSSLLITVLLYFRNRNFAVRLMVIAVAPLAIVLVGGVIYLPYLYHLLHNPEVLPVFPSVLSHLLDVAWIISEAWMIILIACILFIRFSRLRKRLARQELEREQEKSALVEQQKTALSQQVTARTAELKRSLEDLQSAQKQLIRSQHQLKELDQLKSRFFANISHEFRTPLTLVIGPLEDLMNGGDEKVFKEMVPEMHRNSKRLLQLINQLLDLSRLDAGKYKINAVCEGIIPFVKQIVRSFSSMADRKDIRLETEVDPNLRTVLSGEQVFFYFDEDIIEKILTNLLSNAFKFTLPNGRGNILVALSLSEKTPGFLEVKVTDNGGGIPADRLPYIFNRFYQAENTGQTAGSGIGLALTKELVELHGGKITVTSEPGKGTSFSCLLPFSKKALPGEVKTAGQKTNMGKTADITEDEEGYLNENGKLKNREYPVVLLVEDQRDVRQYIGAHLKDRYIILEASNGEQGWQTATENIPDLVVSDVMMPEMNGYELCTALKTDNRTSHIPVILLTARAEDSDKMAGLGTGADAYLVKPFSSKELRLRVENLINSRNKMRARFSGRLVIKPAEIAVTSTDRKFMQNLLGVIEPRLDDAGFSVEELGNAVNMSISQVNRKLKAIINQSASQFIRSVRLERALELLKNDAGRISEIAFKTGFEDPSYFTKVFKAQFGCLPSEKEKFPK